MAVLAALLVAGCSGAGPTPQIIYVTPPPASPAPTPIIIYVTPAPTATSTPTPVAGSGVISFGRNFNASTLLIQQPTTKFAAGQQIAWSAEFVEPAGATSLEWLIAKVSTGGSETVAYSTKIQVSNPTFDLLANKADLSSLLSGPGKYVMRYFRGSNMLAEGTFTLTP